MTTRDPRFRAPHTRPGPDSQASGRDPTQSLSLSSEEADAGFLDEPSHPSLALGTHDAGREERTKIESPAAQKRTPAPAAPRTPRPPPIPRGSDEPDRVGSVLGSYRVLELLGKGGMGYVFRAEHVKLGREVALKLLRIDYARRRDAVARFFQEARTVNRVRHRNIVDVTDFVELADGTTFIIMEFLRGQSLGKWARTGIDLPRALAVLVQICDGLGAAHQVGVIHRDLKPDNIIVVPTSDGAELVKLLDFGVAKLLNRDDEDVGFQTAAGSVIGTPAYMSPEQAGGMAIDARSDIYSLGAIMYELFCGQPMFRGRSFGEYVRKHLTEMPVPPRQTEAGRTLDPLIEALIMRCLEKDPNQRFASILELRDALLGMLGGLETHPPGLANLSMSGLRPPPLAAMPPTVVPAVGAPTMVPHAMATVIPQVPMMQHLPTPGSSQISVLSGSQPSAVHYGYTGYTGIVQPPPPAPTPIWVWLVGGALAVGLGVAAAVWYAGKTEPAPLAAAPAQPAAPSAIASEAIDPADVAGPQQLQLTFKSTPDGAGVFAEGAAAELCRTPCEHTVNLRDGGSRKSRGFVVKRDGYEDARVFVDLEAAARDAAMRERVLALEPSGPTIPAQQPAVAAPERNAPDDDDQPDDVAAPSSRTKAPKSTKSAKSAKIERADRDPKPAATAPPVPPTPPEPDVKKPEPKKPDRSDRIDKTETLDPFRKR